MKTGKESISRHDVEMAQGPSFYVAQNISSSMFDLVFLKGTHYLDRALVPLETLRTVSPIKSFLTYQSVVDRLRLYGINVTRKTIKLDENGKEYNDKIDLLEEDELYVISSFDKMNLRLLKDSELPLSTRFKVEKYYWVPKSLNK